MSHTLFGITSCTSTRGSSGEVHLPSWPLTGRRGRISCSRWWIWTSDLPASGSRVLGLQMCSGTTSFVQHWGWNPRLCQYLGKPSPDWATSVASEGRFRSMLRAFSLLVFCWEIEWFSSFSFSPSFCLSSSLFFSFFSLPSLPSNICSVKSHYQRVVSLWKYSNSEIKSQPLSIVHFRK